MICNDLGRLYVFFYSAILNMDENMWNRDWDRLAVTYNYDFTCFYMPFLSNNLTPPECGGKPCGAEIVRPINISFPPLQTPPSSSFRLSS
jgi:hypothetical protein